MTAQQLILDHNLWRKGQGGAPAGVIGQQDANAYAGLDLNHITFTGSGFNASNFSSCTFLDAVWTDCQFTACTFTHCDLSRVAMQGCTFVDCRFTRFRLDRSQLSGCTFTNGAFDNLCLDDARWQDVRLLACTGHRLSGANWRGERVDFSGSRFNDMHLSHSQIN